MTTRIKGCVHAAAIALLLPAVASAETVPLFDATPVTSVSFGTDFSRTDVFKETDVTVYCVAPGKADVFDDEGDPPIVDNYMTAGNDLQSICEGGSDIKSQGIAISGTHCFNGGDSNTTGGDIRNTFNADDVTASVDLLVGENNLTFKLWDYGVVYGNTPLDLVLPEGCSTFECWENETAWSEGERYVERGNWATYTDISGDAMPVILYAAQNLKAGTVNFEILGTPPNTTKITITLNDGFRFALDEDNEPVFENLKIQGYEDEPINSGNPSPGKFAFKSTESGSSATVEVPYAVYYGVHVDVEVGVEPSEPEYAIEVTRVNGNASFSHSYTLSFDSDGNLTGTGQFTGSDPGFEETLSEFFYDLNDDGEITYVSFRADYSVRDYTWYPAFTLNDDGTLTFVDVDDLDNVNSAIGTWTMEKVCSAN